MVHLIAVHIQLDKKRGGERCLVNPENISYIRPMTDGGSYICFCCFNHQNNIYQGLHVMESLDEILNLIKKS